MPPELLRQADLDYIRQLVIEGCPVPAEFVKRLLTDRDEWIIRAKEARHAT